MARERNNRKYYEFPDSLKRKVRQEQKHRCAVTGEKSRNLQVHHLLGCALAAGFFPTVNPAIFRQKENAVAISEPEHKRLHAEMKQWPPEVLRAFVVGLYSWLRDIYYDKLAEMQTAV